MSDAGHYVVGICLFLEDINALLRIKSGMN